MRRIAPSEVGVAATLAVAAVAVALSGCPADAGPQPPSCTVSDDLPDGELHGDVDGDAWVAQANGFQVVASGMILGFNVDAHNTMTIRLRFAQVFGVDEETGEWTTEEGAEIQEIHDDRAVPADFLVGDGSRDGADVTIVVDDVTMHSSDADEDGFLRLVEYREDEDTGAETLCGCGFFDAAEQEGDEEASMTGMQFAIAVP